MGDSQYIDLARLAETRLGRCQEGSEGMGDGTECNCFPSSVGMCLCVHAHEHALGQSPACIMSAQRWFADHPACMLRVDK